MTRSLVPMRLRWPLATGALLAALAGPSGAATLVQPCADQQPPAPLTLVAAIDFALCHNPQTRSAWANIRSNEAGVAAIQALYLPSASASLSASRNHVGGDASNSHGAQLQLALTLFDFGQRDARLEQAQALLGAAQSSAEQTVSEIWLQTINAYLNQAKATGQWEAAQVAETAARASREAAEARLQVGSVAPLDALQAQSAEALAALNRVKASSQIDSARADLAQALGLRPDKVPALAAVPATTETLALDETAVAGLLQQAGQQRNDVQAARASLRAAEASLNNARLGTQPTLSLSASAGLNRPLESDRRFSNSVGLNLSIPFDLNGANRAQIAQAEAQRESRAAELARSQQSAESDAWRAWSSLRAAQQSVRYADVAARSAIRAAEVALGRYRAGVGPILDVLTAQSNEASARQQQIAARHDVLAARASLAYALGGQLPDDPTRWSSQFAPAQQGPGPAQ